MVRGGWTARMMKVQCGLRQRQLASPPARWRRRRARPGSVPQSRSPPTPPLGGAPTDRAAGPGRVRRRAAASPRCGMREAIEDRAEPAAVPRHLRRHAADGGARPGARITPGRLIAGDIAELDAARPAAAPMGWNELEFRPVASAAGGFTSGDHAYFVHSYALEGAAARSDRPTDYGGPVSPSRRRQSRRHAFHVEKARRLALRILTTFLGWKP